MYLKTLRLDRVFDVAADPTSRDEASRVLFSFESNGKRHFSVKAYRPVVPKPGQTITALLARPDDWQSIEGFIIHETRELSYPDMQGYGIALLVVNALFVGVSYLTFAHDEPHVQWIAAGLHVALAMHAVWEIRESRRIRRILRGFERANLE